MRKTLGFLLAAVLFAQVAFALTAEEKEGLGHAAALSRAGKFREAVEAYRLVLDINPESLYAFQGMGLAYVQLREYDKAFEAFEEALFINPNFPEAHYGLGVVYPLAKRDKKKAIYHYKMYLRLSPNAPDAAKVREWIERLTLSGTVKRDEKMVDLYNQGVDAYNRGEFEEAADLYLQAMKRNPHYAPNHHALGLAYTRVGQYYDAAVEFEETLKIDPRHVESHYALGVVYPVFQQYDKAIFHYTQYLKLNPEAEDAGQVRGFIEKLQTQKKAAAGTGEIAFYNQGVDLYDKGKFAEAAAAYEKALQLKPGMEDALRGLGLCRIQLKQYREAYDLLQRARKIDPANPENYYSLGVLHTLLGDPVSGVASYAKYLQLNPDAPDREKVEEWMEKLSGRLDVGFFNRGVEYYEAKNFAKALESFLQAMEYNPKFDEAQRMIGFVYIQTKDIPSALRALESALEMNSESPETHYALGVANTLAGKAKEAAEHYGQYKAMAPQAEDVDTVNQWIARLQTKSAADTYDHGVDLYDQGKYDEAQKEFLEALALDASVPDVHRALGLVYLQKKDLDAAEQSFTQALQLKEGSPETQYCLGVLYTLLGQPEKSLEHYQTYEALIAGSKDAQSAAAFIGKLKSHVADICYNQGLEYYQQKKYPEAEQNLEKAVENNPRFGDAYRVLGMARLQRKNLTGAKEALQTALTLNPQDPEIHYALGVFYVAAKEPAKAANAYERYLELKPAAQDKATVAEWLEKLRAGAD